MKFLEKPKGIEEKISPVEAIKLIRGAGGLAVWAHPWLKRELFNERNLRRFVKVGLNGIELDNGDNNSHGRNKTIVNRIKRYAKKYDLILTRGSDYHGTASNGKSGHDLGNTLCDEETVRALEALRKR